MAAIKTKDWLTGVTLHFGLPNQKLGRTLLYMAQGKNRMLMRLNANSRKNNPLVDISSYLYFLVRVARQGGGKETRNLILFIKNSPLLLCVCLHFLFILGSRGTKLVT